MSVLSILQHPLLLLSTAVVIRFFVTKPWLRFTESCLIKGRRFVITGANRGIGLSTAEQIYSMGGHVTMACRNVKSAEKAKRYIERTVRPSIRGGSIDVVECDLNSFKSIREAVESMNEKYEDINVLINNAAIMGRPFKMTEDGFEQNMQTNHLGSALLTTLLSDKLEDTANKSSVESRIVFVSSSLYRFGKIRDIDLVQNSVLESKWYRKTAYKNSKLANLLWARQHNRILKKKNFKTTVNLSSPGMVFTGLDRGTKIWIKLLSIPLIFLFIRTPFEGSQNILYTAASPKLDGKSGSYYKDFQLKPFESDGLDLSLAERVYALTKTAIKEDPMIE